MSTTAAMPHAIITDIEGTISAIAFVRDVLFPYAREHLPEFVRSHGQQTAVRRWLRQTAHDAGIDEDDDDAIIGTLLAWIDADRKATPLKALQGMIWKRGYESGAYRAHIYADVPPQLRRWHAAGIGLHVYSSGSVAAQQLFLKYSVAGDLTPLFSGCFDTESGPKRAAASYHAIASAIAVAPAAIAFLSDTVEELDAAAQTGMRTIRLCRPPVACPLPTTRPWVSRFDEITF